MRSKAANYSWPVRAGVGRAVGVARAWGARVRAVVVRERLFVVALVAGVALRLLAMLGYPGAVWFEADSSIYLGAALRLRQAVSRVSGYSLFLRVLEPFHSLTLVTGVQHLMGLGIAVLVYALARRAGVRRRGDRGRRGAAGRVRDRRRRVVMPEALFTLLVMAAMALILWRGRVQYGRLRCWPGCWPDAPSTCAPRACPC